MRRLFLTTILTIALSLVLTGAVSASTINKSVTPAVNLSNGLVGWWTFDGGDCDANNCFDKSGGNYTATSTGATVPRSVSGKIGQAKKFDGSDDLLQAADINFTDNTKLSLSYWFKLNVVSTNLGFVTKWVYQTQGEFGCQTDFSNADELRCWVASSLTDNGVNTGHNTTNANLVANRWYHMVFVYDGGGSANGDKIKIFLDGVNKTLSYGSTIPATLQDSTAPLRLGMWNGTLTRNLNGYLDDVRVYNRALSQAEITALYKQGGGKLNVSPANKPNLNSGLVGWWTMDGADCDASSCFDKSGNGNTATSSAGVMPARVSGKIGQAMKFDGVNDYLNFGTNDSLNIVTGTISVWFKKQGLGGGASAYHGLVQRVDDSSNGYQLFIPNSDNKFKLYSGGTVSASTYTLGNNNWHHYVAVSNNNKVYFYVDGIAYGTANIMFSSAASPTKYGIGRYLPNNDDVNGSIDDVRVYSRALSTAEIQQLYKQGGGKLNVSPTNKPNLNSGLVGWWTFDGKDRVTSVTSTDKSGNGNDGGAYGDAVLTAGKIGQGLNFGGSTGYVQTADKDYFSPASTTVVSLSFWGKVPATAPVVGNAGECGGAGAYFISKGADPNWEWGFENAGNTAICLTTWPLSGLSQRGLVKITRTVNDGRWHHYAATISDGTRIEVFIDGVSASSTTSFNGAAMGNGTQPLQIGRRGDAGTFFTGKLDDVRVYNRALTQAEITQLYKMGK